MKIIPSDKPFDQVSGNRVQESGTPRTEVRFRGASRSATEEDQPVPEIRKQLIVVQRSLGRYQRMLGGLEGFKILLETDARVATDYIGQVLYRGEAVLEPLSDQLNRILQDRDLYSLQRLIDAAKKEIHGLAVQLSRLETAEQNNRSLVFGEAALSSVLEGIRAQGDQLLKLEGKNVLDLLG